MTPEPSLEALREVTVADVYKGGVKAAKLSRTPQGIEFRYRGQYIAENAPAVATTLPLSDQPTHTTAGSVPPFFAGLLPEGRRLLGLRRAVKTSADDELSLLLAVGRDTVGDVQVVAEGSELTSIKPLLEVQREWTEVKFAEVLADANIDRVGIPGAQDKASAGMISVPLSRSGNRYILKVDPPDHPRVVEDEAFFLGLARQARLPAAAFEVVHDAEDVSGLLVTRFDRVRHKKSVSPLACEDACQVLSLWPADKYNVSCETVVNALADKCPARAVAALAFFRQVCFAWLTGNGDLHAKNLSILATLEGEWRAAPAYDILSTVPYGDHTFALQLQGTTTGHSRRKLLAFGEAVGLSERARVGALDDLLERTAGLEDQLEDLPFDAGKIRATRAELKFRRRLALGAGVESSE